METPVNKPNDLSSAGRFLPRLLLIVVAVVVMANLNALVDMVFHPEIGYFDEEHIMVGFFTGLMTAILLGGLFSYTRRLEKIVAKYRQSIAAGTLSEEKYRDLFDSSQDIFFMSTLDGRFEEINPAGARLLGYSSVEELKKIDLNNDLYFSPADRLKYRRQIEAEGSLNDCEIEMRKKNGEQITVLVTAEIIHDERGAVTGYRGSMRDVTEKKEMKKQMMQMQKMESIGKMAGGIAHDFSNYLTTIRGYEEMAIAEAPEGSPLRDHLEKLRSASKNASDLTNQLLVFSQYHPIETTPIDLNNLVAGLLGKIDQIAGDDVAVSTDLVNDNAIISGDSGSIGQTLINLVKNAKAAMPDGGNILLKTERTKINHAYANMHPGSYPGEFLSLSVSDTGTGMDEETRDHIFEPIFTSLSETGSSLGLSLSVVYGVVNQHDGWVEVTSAPHKGSTFRLFFPMSRDNVLPASDQGADMSIKGQGEKILLVEDDEAVRVLTEKMLKQNGYTVMGVGDANSAFDVFAREKGDFQLIFSDVELPGEDGVKLVEHLHSYKPEVPVLLVSGYSDIIADWRFTQEKGYRFMQKPYVLPNLLQTIRELLNSHN